MARARMVARSLGASERFARLRADSGRKDWLGLFAQALFPLLVVNADDWGRLKADPWSLKYDCWPSAPDPLGTFAEGLERLEAAGLVQIYEADAQICCAITDFDVHQPGLNRERRIPSKFPDPPVVPRNARTPAQRTANRRDQKVSDQKRTLGTAESPDEPATPSATGGKGEGNEEGNDLDGKTVHAFLKRFCDLYAEHRAGAKYLVKPAKDVPTVRRLLKAYGHDRLVEMTVGMLGSTDAFIVDSDHGIGILSAKANWLNERLAKYEQQQRRHA